MTTTETKKKKRGKLVPHPVALPADYYSEARRAGEKDRRATGYTSLRVSKRTAELVKRMQEQAQKHANDKRNGGTRSYFYGRSWYNLGADELLYWDALQRLGELPANLEKD